MAPSTLANSVCVVQSGRMQSLNEGIPGGRWVKPFLTFLVIHSPVELNQPNAPSPRPVC